MTGPTPPPGSHNIVAPRYYKYGTVCVDVFGQVFLKDDLPDGWFPYTEVKTNLTIEDFDNPLYFKSKGAILSWLLRVRRLSGT